MEITELLYNQLYLRKCMQKTHVYVYHIFNYIFHLSEGLFFLPRLLFLSLMFYIHKEGKTQKDNF